MKPSNRRRPATHALAALLLAWLPLAVAETAAAAPAHTGVECVVIERLPYVIGEPGLYCLTRSHEIALTGGAAIEVQADHVTVDLGGHTIDNTRGGLASKALGIFSWERGHVVVKNGTLVSFEEAVALSGPFGGSYSFNHRVEDLRVVNSGESAIGITGNDSVVRGNTIHHVGIGLSSKDPVSGIVLGGYRNRAIDNDVIRVTGPENPVAIRFVYGGGNMALDNRISSAETAILFPVGQTGFYRDNLATEVACCNPFEGGTDLGGNAWQ